MFLPLSALRRFCQYNPLHYNPDLLRKIAAKDDLTNFQSLWAKKIFEKKQVLDAVRRNDHCDPVVASWTHDHPEWLDEVLKTNHILDFLKKQL